MQPVALEDNRYVRWIYFVVFVKAKPDSLTSLLHLNVCVKRCSAREIDDLGRILWYGKLRCASTPPGSDLCQLSRFFFVYIDYIKFKTHLFYVLITLLFLNFIVNWKNIKKGVIVINTKWKCHLLTLFLFSLKNYVYQLYNIWSFSLYLPLKFTFDNGERSNVRWNTRTVMHVRTSVVC